MIRALGAALCFSFAVVAACGGLGAYVETNDRIEALDINARYRMAMSFIRINRFVDAHGNPHAMRPDFPLQTEKEVRLVTQARNDDEAAIPPDFYLLRDEQDRSEVIIGLAVVAGCLGAGLSYAQSRQSPVCEPA